MIASNTPTTPFENGRDASGRFAKGNPGGPGNPHSRKVHVLRSAFLKAIKPSDLREVTEKLVELAKSGDLDAMTLLYERVFGKPIQRDEELQSIIDEATARFGGPR
ncbi:MAG: hypothetical protein U0836_17940 [Pirellulales bacterium]